MSASPRPVITLKKPLKRPAPPAVQPAAPVPAQQAERPVPGADVDRREFWFSWSPSEFRPSRRFATAFACSVEVKRLRALYPEKLFHGYRAECIDFDERPPA